MSLPPQDNPPDDQEFSEENESTEQKQPPRSRAIIAGLRRHKLAVVAIALISGFLLYTLVLDRPDNSSPPSESPPHDIRGSGSADRNGSRPWRRHGRDHNTPPMGVAGQYRVVARGFAQDFTTPGADWLERVSRWVTPTSGGGLHEHRYSPGAAGAAGRPRRILHRSFCFRLHRHLRHRPRAGYPSGVQLHRLAGQHLPTDEDCVLITR